MKYSVILYLTIFLFSSFSEAKIIVGKNINKNSFNELNTNTSFINNYYAPADKLFVQTQSRSLGKFVPITGNLEQMKYFFEALKQSANKKIRIAHYGDSLVQGDIITEYIREKFQDRFGGKGAGFLNIVSNDIRMRNTTIHSFSDNWEYASIITRNPNQIPFGISGAVSIPRVNSWVKYETSNHLKSTRFFEKVEMYYSNGDETTSFQYTVNGKVIGKVSLEKGEEVKVVSIPITGNGNSIELKFLGGKAPYVYGVSLESNHGIYVDNFPMPGNSGVSLLEIPERKLIEFNKLMDYGLIILTYGANVNAPNRGIYTLYENKMLAAIEQFKKAFPKTSILLVSVGDKTMKRGNRFITNPDVPILLETQKKIVEKGNIAFWNMWEAMGGNNSMEDWVNSAPPMALKDYSHFTSVGGERIAQLLFESLMDQYQKK